MANIINVPIQDEASFYATVYPYVQGLGSPENISLQVTAGALLSPTARDAAYTAIAQVIANGSNL